MSFIPVGDRHPGKRIVLVRTSERTGFKKCRWLWYTEYVERQKPMDTSPPLRFGDLIHQALEARYPPGVKRGPHPAATFEKLYNKQLAEQAAFGFKDEDDKWHDALGLGIDMMENFVDTFGKDAEWKVIASEFSFQVLIYEDETTAWYYVGTVDGLWENRSSKEKFIKDWKTCKSITGGRHLPMDEQPSAYWEFAPIYLRDKGIIKPKEKIHGIHFTYLRKGLRDERETNELGQCLNKDGSVSKQQPSPYFANVPTYRDAYEAEMMRKRILAEIKEMDMVRHGYLDAYKNPGQFTCGMGCALRDICELHEIGADWETLRDATFTEWDPYAAHEIYAAERN